eukprot:sb/3467701/
MRLITRSVPLKTAAPSSASEGEEDEDDESSEEEEVEEAPHPPQPASPILLTSSSSEGETEEADSPRKRRKMEAPILPSYLSTFGITVPKTPIKSNSDKKSKRKPPLIRCGKCTQCVQGDCGTCKFCLDMPCFGGPNKRRHSCIHRKCLAQVRRPSCELCSNSKETYSDKQIRDNAEGKSQFTNLPATIDDSPMWDDIIQVSDSPSKSVAPLAPVPSKSALLAPHHSVISPSCSSTTKINLAPIQQIASHIVSKLQKCETLGDQTENLPAPPSLTYHPSSHEPKKEEP